MGTRSGDIDPAVLFHLHRQAGLGLDELEVLLNRGSGLLGLTGHGDMRDVQAAELDGDPRAVLALEVYRHRIRRYVGAYTAELGGLDAVVFTAGVGEHDSLLRRRSLAGLEHLGIAVDPDRNELASTHARRISPEGSPVAVLVVPTDEEWEIARQAAEVVCRVGSAVPAAHGGRSGGGPARVAPAARVVHHEDGAVRALRAGRAD